MRFDGTRPRTSHGSGRWRREDFAAWGEGTTVEETALVFRPEHVRLGSGVYVGHGAILKAYDGGELEVGDGTWIGEHCYANSAGGLRLGKRLAPDLSLADEALPYLAEALGIPAPPRPAGASR